MTLGELYDYLTTNPGHSYNTLPTEHQQLLAQTFADVSFSTQHNLWLEGFYLVVPSNGIEARIQSRLPSHLGIEYQTLSSGELALPARLLTDAMYPDNTWYDLSPVLFDLEIRKD